MSPATVKRGFVGGAPTVYWASCECGWYSKNGDFSLEEEEAERLAAGHRCRLAPADPFNVRPLRAGRLAEARRAR